MIFLLCNYHNSQHRHLNRCFFHIYLHLHDPQNYLPSLHFKQFHYHALHLNFYHTAVSICLILTNRHQYNNHLHYHCIAIALLYGSNSISPLVFYFWSRMANYLRKDLRTREEFCLAKCHEDTLLKQNSVVCA